MYQPSKDEYGQFYEGYVKSIRGNVISSLENQVSEMERVLKGVPPEKYNYAYAEGKWTVKQLVSHLIDTERVMVYRALRFSRNDFTELAGFDENAYVANTDLQHISYESLVEELLSLRKANLFFFKSLKEDDYHKKGLANGYPLSVGALLFVVAGHVSHHLRILKERYL